MEKIAEYFLFGLTHLKKDFESGGLKDLGGFSKQVQEKRIGGLNDIVKLEKQNLKDLIKNEKTKKSSSRKI